MKSIKRKDAKAGTKIRKGPVANLGGSSPLWG
jgi:hypothetical protein